MKNKDNVFRHLKFDLPASLVVFLVALPLCLGIALASEAPMFSGIIAGIIGGIVVGSISGAHMGVSGPAAGLAVIVANGIKDLGTTANGDFDMMVGFQAFLVAGVIAGVLQLILGLLKAGIIGYYFPVSVIKGMLAGIGLTLILKQIPHALGWDKNPEGSWDFYQSDGHNTFSEIGYAFENFSMGAVIIVLISLLVLILFQQNFIKKNKILSYIPGPLIVVISGILINEALKYFYPEWGLGNEKELIGDQIRYNNHLVYIEPMDSSKPFLGLLTFPDWSILNNPKIYLLGFTVAIVASLETLLCVEATDKIDPHKRITPTNRELYAQGTGNIVSSLLGGLPVTQVIVRSSANINAGAKTKMSAIFHGVLLTIFVLAFPFLLNLIPLSCLAAILLMVGYKLASVPVFKKMYQLGWSQFIPFIATILIIIFKDLLWGISIGLAIGFFNVLYNSYRNNLFLHKEVNNEENIVKIKLAEEVSFLNKAAISRELDKIEPNTNLEIDVRNNIFVDYDIAEIFEDFSVKAKEKNIAIKLFSKKGVINNPDDFYEFFLSKTYQKK